MVILNVACIKKGMVPHKTKRGKEALQKLKALEGIPAPYDKQKRMVVPSCLRAIKLKPRRAVSRLLHSSFESWKGFFKSKINFQFCELSRISHEVGWKYQDVVATLETKRKVKSKLFYDKKQREVVSGHFWLFVEMFWQNFDSFFFYLIRNSERRPPKTSRKRLPNNNKLSSHLVINEQSIFFIY